jgi:hypothetical protein
MASKGRADGAVRKPRVGWYDPRQLLKTAPEVAISTISGRHADHRLVEAMTSATPQPLFYDYTCHYFDLGNGDCRPDEDRPRDSIWIDYVADIGDGWNSTYAVAYQLAQPKLDLRCAAASPDGPAEVSTERGDILIFGGDEVYPTPSRKEYHERLVAPYDTALHVTHGTHPHLFAIPGNHDWYDSLVAFSRMFMSRRWFCGWRTRQTRSYFALKLPHNWWLLGTDLQLGSEIDAPQLLYFERVAVEMREEERRTGRRARVILCHAEPHWIYSEQYQGLDRAYDETNLKKLEKELGRGVAVFIAGDLHHYRRHATVDGSTQKITSGGGGAFLHPTHLGWHGPDLERITEKPLPSRESEPERVFELRESYPPTRVSRRLAWLNLVFPYLPGNRSRTFGLATAGLYLLLTLPLLGQAGASDVSVGSILRAIYDHSTSSRLAGIATLLFYVGFWLFTDTHSRAFKRWMSVVHASAHLFGAFAIASLSIEFATSHLPLPRIAAGVLVLLGGYVVGSLVMGIYLLFSLNVFGRHGNEAFSSLAIQDWKHFLRLHIDRNGDLTIYPVGIQRVPRKWKANQSGTGPELLPDDPRATRPELIEPPIPICRADESTATGVRAMR